MTPFATIHARGTIVIMHDLTQVRRLEKVRSDFVANVSHELKTPLTSIKGYVETLLNGAMSQPDIALRFLRKVEANANRLTLLVKDILTLSQTECPNREAGGKPICWLEIIRSCLCQYDHMIKTKKISVELGVPANIEVLGDWESLTQIFENLLTNAIRYMKPGGKLTLSWRCEDNYGILSVSDTGIGIPQEDLERIFERFYRVDKDRSRQLGGTGLGLSIVKHTVGLLGGTVALTSQFGSGSTFHVHLPLAPQIS
jgi:two-component system phosphate regulon sensor histidine kinase PhoR